MKSRLGNGLFSAGPITLPAGRLLTLGSLRIILAVLLLLPWLLHAPGHAAAQTPDTLWSAPLNLSESGAASQPMLFAAPDGTLQAFWWDRFDGLTTTIGQGQDGQGQSGQGQSGQGQTWSAPRTVQIYVTELRVDRVVSRPLEAMPALEADGAGRVNAFWQDRQDAETGLRPLLHSRLSVGTTDWSPPDVISANNAVTATVALDAAALPGGGLALAYIREARTASDPPGLYFRRMNSQGAWDTAVLVYPSPYLRLPNPSALRLRLTASPDGALYLAWTDSSLAQTLYARSGDGGLTWSAPQPMAAFASLGSAPVSELISRMASLPCGGLLFLHEAQSSGACALYQQLEETAVPAPAASPTLTNTTSVTITEILTATQPGEPTAIPPAAEESDAAAPGSAAVRRILDGARTCPVNDRFWLQGDRLFWVWGEDTGQLTLLAWDADHAQWSEPWALDLRLREPNSERWLAWDALRLLQAQDSLFVLGLDAATGDVWLTQAPISAIETTYAAPSPWSQTEAPSEWSAAAMATGAQGLALALDRSGTAHAAWVSGRDGTATAALYYARSDGARWSRAAEVARATAAGEILRHPALLADGQGLLHLAWSGGEAGQIFYSRAKVAEATTVGWSAPQELPAPALAADWPQLGVDASGRLTVAYVVPINEQRGVYLVQTQDGGETWSSPQQVFDAAGAGWTMADHLALAVALDGALHLAWAKAGMPGTDAAQGIYYTSSTAPTNAPDPQSAPTWGEPIRLAEAGFDWPQLLWVRGDVHLLYARQSDGTLWHRWIDGLLPSSSTPGEDRAAWKPAARVPGWQNMALPVGLGLAGDTLHLAGIDRGGAPYYASWEHTTAEAPRWSQAETFWLGPEVAGGLGASAAAAPLGGRLAVAWRVQWAALPPAPAADAPIQDRSPSAADLLLDARLISAERTIPTVDPATRPTWAPTPRPTDTPAPTPTATPLPTPAPDLSGPPVSSSSALSNLLLGGGLAAGLVLLALGVRSLFGRGRNLP